MSDSVTPWTAARQASLSFTISQSLLKFMPIESAVLSNHLILCRCIPLLPSIFPSIRVLATVNNVTVNSGTQITQRFLWLLEQKGHCWISRQFLFFNFLRKLHCFPKWLCHFTVPATVHRSSLLSTFSLIIAFRCSFLENPGDGGAWWAAVYGVAQSRTRLKQLSSSSSSSKTRWMYKALPMFSHTLDKSHLALSILLTRIPPLVQTQFPHTGKWY